APRRGSVRRGTARPPPSPPTMAGRPSPRAQRRPKPKAEPARQTPAEGPEASRGWSSRMKENVAPPEAETPVGGCGGVAPLRRRRRCAPGARETETATMPKMKTHSGAAKRFRVTGTGKVMRRRANRNHLLEHKSSRRTRRLTADVTLAPADVRKTKKLLAK